MLNIKQFTNGLRIIPVLTSSINRAGEMEVLSSDGNLYYFDGNSKYTVANSGNTLTFINKTIDGDLNTITNISLTTDITGTLGIGNGGTGQTTQQAALNALSGSQTSGTYLRSDGTNVTLSVIQAGDVPTLNQNTTGTASNVTGIVAIINGGTGQSTSTLAFNALQPMSASGDVIYGGASGVATVLHKGSDGQVLTLSSGIPSWAAATGVGAITALTGDVSASGPGSAAATVNSVGGSSASNIHSAELLANAATNLNTVSTIVKRDSSGNFSAGLVALGGATIGGQGITALTGNSLAITGALNQNLVIQSSGTGTLQINTNGVSLAELASTPSAPASSYSEVYFKTDHNLYIQNSSGTENYAGHEQAVVTLDEQGSSPSSPSSGKLLFYSKSDNNLYIKNSSGVETVLAANVPIRSTVQLSGNNNYGSTNTVIKRFTTTIVNTGSDITYADSATAGGSFTINTAGIYTISYSDGSTAGARNIGVSLNSNQLTTSITSITNANIVGMAITVTSQSGLISATLPLAVNDVIRAHDDGNPLNLGTQCRFTITRVNI